MRRVVLAAFILASTAAAQPKVGTTGASFLEIVTSVPALGMGQLELIVPEGSNFNDNPALLPYSNSVHLQVGGNPSWTEYAAKIFCYDGYVSYGLRFGNSDLNSSLNAPVWRVSAAYRYFTTKAQALVEQTYSQGNVSGTGREFISKDQIQQFTVGVSRSGSTYLALGASVKRYREEFADYLGQGFSYDAGTYASVPIIRPGVSRGTGAVRELELRGLIGAVYSNFGPRMEYIGSYYSLPHCWRFSVGAEASYRSFRILGGVEQRRWPIGMVASTHYGLEVEWRNAITARTGYGRLNAGYIEIGSLGVTVSSKGLMALVGVKSADLPFDLKVNYARTESASGIYDGLDYWSLQLEI